ncbi:amine acid ABC transporter, permease protein, 3-TM region, His/Glu/Gln/Arg/opine family [Rubellimicrobium thermophilum DSM 16684]|uniref:Amine acid ABC transporter, permease protein, 3-TM region, His/Glu/Gln/Arg/opine family n=1 Tax=Rubellimicrobium thermophilum DSM 16684 TaxID=1123069 RepID=S9SDE6_9RHOB|nr:amine acid ABC transporter, permease protein, 3-TM region, His/Glu/Gln/Arg/opine family [Rubellimicrobium thermophilum DSM 16684]
MSDLHSQTVAYTRDTMLPPAPPPVRERGAIKWLRENLFSGPFNIALTLITLWLLWLALSEVLPWMWRGIWDAGSVTECRARPGCALRAGGAGRLLGRHPGSLAPARLRLLPRRRTVAPAAGACGLPHRHHAGPLHRPASAPAGVHGRRPLPDRLADLGGAIWGPAMVALGFVLGWAVWRLLLPRSNPGLAFTGGVLAALLWWLFLTGPVAGMLARLIPIALNPVPSDRIGGFTLSLLIGLSGITLSLPLGILLALARRSDLWIVSKAAVIYIEVIRGVPLIVWLLVAQILLNYFLPSRWSIDILVRVIVMVTLFAAAYIAEVIRGGLAAIPRGQFEAADSLGLGYWETMRLIVLPQALTISIPGIVNSFIGLLKDTTLVSIISLFDPKRMTDTIRATTEWGGIYWELYIFVGTVFFVFCFAMSRYSIWLEQRLERSHR